MSSGSGHSDATNLEIVAALNWMIPPGGVSTVTLIGDN
jgi:hypothetical protein